MRIVIAAVGRLKGEERALVERYVERLNGIGRRVSLGPAAVVEIVESKAQTDTQRRDDEARRLLAALPEGARATVALDPIGRALTSEAFATHLARERDGAVTTLAFLIGGPDGHGEAARAASGLKLSLGPMTLPHGLARAVLTEQLYRAATILAGHPYHRA